MLCTNCNKRNKCKKVCKEIEKILMEQGIRDINWIRPQISRSERKRLKKQGYKNIHKWREIPASHRIYGQFRPIE